MFDDYDNDERKDKELIKTGFGAKDSTIKNLNILYNILLGFIADGEIQEEEKEYLKKWQNEHAHERGVTSLRPILSAIDDALFDNVLTFEEVLGLIQVIEQNKPSDNNYLIETVDTQFVLGICNGIIADGKITDEEARLLLHTLQEHSRAEVSSDWSVCFSRVESILSSGRTLSSDMLDEIRRHIKDFISCPSEDNLPVDFTDSQFVLSGQFALGKKKDVGKLIVDRGGTTADSVTKKTRYVVVGGTRSVLWKYDNYGTKVQKAKNLKEDGQKIDIISENNLAVALK